jgi:queuosine precursor transporter
MNEILFFSEIAILVFFLLLSLKLGKYALITFVSLQTIFANLFVTKQMELFSLTVTCSDVYVVSAIFGLNLLQEYFGKKEAKKAIYVSFIFLVLFMILVKMHLLYIPSSSDYTQSSFLTIFSHIPRIVFASVTVFFLVQWLDLFFYDFLKKRVGQSSLVLRMGFSSILSQIVDSLLFSFLGLYGIVDHIWDVIFFSFLVKLLTIASWSGFMIVLNKIFKLKRQDELL